MKLILIRHGQYQGNVDRTVHEDPEEITPLTDFGVESVRKSAQKLKGKGIQIIFSSPMYRTKETTKIVNEVLNLDVVEDERLIERQSGFQGKTIAEFDEACGDDYFNYKFLGGESFQEEKARVKNFLDELKTKDYEKVLIVSHQEPLQVLAGLVLGQTDEEMMQDGLDNAEIQELDL